jgi:hypothetical protein
VVAKKEEQEELSAAYHESPWARHYKTWATFEKLKGPYQDMHWFACHNQSSSTTIDLKDTNMTKRKPDMNKKKRFVLPRHLEYKAPKIDIKPEWFNTETTSIFIMFSSLMHARQLGCMHECHVVAETIYDIN